MPSKKRMPSKKKIEDLFEGVAAQMRQHANPAAPRFQEVSQFRKSLREETDRGCVLMACAYLDTGLGELLTAYFVDDKVGREMKNGPLRNVTERIDAAYALGLISAFARRQLLVMNNMRNKFAHSHAPLSFEDQEIANLCKTLEPMHPLATSLRGWFTRTAIFLLALIHFEQTQVKHRDIHPDFLSTKEFGAEAEALLNEMFKAANAETLLNKMFERLTKV